MVFLFRGGRRITKDTKNKKLKEEAERIDKDIKKLLKELREDPFGWHPKKNEECRELIKNFKRNRRA